MYETRYGIRVTQDMCNPKLRTSSLVEQGFLFIHSIFVYTSKGLVWSMKNGSEKKRWFHEKGGGSGQVRVG